MSLIVDPTEENHSKEDLETVARLELGETPEAKQRSLSQLRQLLEDEPGLRIPQDDDFLLMFLRTRKYKVEDAFKTIQKYFRSRRDIPEYFEELSTSSDLYKTFFRDHMLIMYSRDRDPLGRAVALVNYGAWRPEMCSMTELVRCGLWAMECHLLEEETQIRGFVAVIDLKGFGAHHLMELTPWFLRRTLTIAQDSLPARIKAMYFLNTPVVFEVVYAISKPFLKAKLKNRLHFIRKDLSELLGVLPSDLIPKECGGTRENFDYDRQEDFFAGKASHLEEIRQCGYNPKQPVQ